MMIPQRAKQATMAQATKKINIAVAGAAGRMGKAVVAQAEGHPAASPKFLITALIESPSADTIHMPQNGSATHYIMGTDDDGFFSQARIDVLVDFTTPAATLQVLPHCCANNIGMVVGTTGFTDEQKQTLRAAGKSIPILVAQNMSVGVNAFYSIATHAACALGAGRLGGGYDIEIIEAHHRHKKDAPSGTALRLGEALADATSSTLADVAVFARHGADCARQPHEIGFASIRGGDIVGEHRVLFAGSGESIEVIHRSTSRQHYAAGALRAAQFVASAASDFYDGMDAVLAQPPSG